MSGLQRRLEFTLPELLDPTRKHSSQVQLLGYAVGNHLWAGLSNWPFTERWLHCRDGLGCCSTYMCYLGPGEVGYCCLV